MSDVATKEYVDKIMAMSDASTIVEDEPCDVSNETPRSLMHVTVLRLEQLLKDALREVDEYRRAIVDLEGKIQQLEDWKESALAVEREWNPNALAIMLGGKPGESQRKVIQREVPKLLARINRLEQAGDAMDKTAEPFVLDTIDEDIPMSDVGEQCEIIYDSPPTAGDHVAMDRARKDWRKAKEAKPCRYCLRSNCECSDSDIMPDIGDK